MFTSFGSGHAVSALSAAPVVGTGLKEVPSTTALSVLHVESVANVPGAPSCWLRASASVGNGGVVPVRSKTWMNDTYTFCDRPGGPGYDSSVATHCRSSIAPADVPQPRRSVVNVSPRLVERFIVSHGPGRST